MLQLRQILAVCLVAAAATMLVASVSFAQCVSGNIVAELQTTGPYAGLYKYTLTFTWDTPQGLSNVTLDCGFGDCAAFACMQTYAFDTPAGTSDGEGGCTVEYAGEFNCDGNPSIGLDVPIIKWDALDILGCEPANTGSGTLCFYTNIPPHPTAAVPVTLIKNGQDVCSGTVSGDCPAVCVIPTEDRTWGGTKVIYR